VNAYMQEDKNTEAWYLRESVYFEPLIHQWYAWPYLIPPVCLALNFSSRNLRVMKSFLANPRLHQSAAKNASLAGGDFVDCTEDQVQDVRDLVEHIEREYASYAQIRDGVRELNDLLARQEGLSLEGLYASIPSCLRGYVELSYDLHHRASFRVIEGLAYEAGLYSEGPQSVLFGALQQGEMRPFVLSSPRLPDSKHLHVDLAFRDPVLDMVFAARTRPIALSDIQSCFEGKRLRGGLDPQALFTKESPARQSAPLGGDIRIRFMGHAGLLCETKDVCIMVDPVIASISSADQDAFSWGEVPETVDFICLTHTHMDHVCIETLLQLRHKTKRVLVPKNNGGTIADPSLRLMLTQLGFAVSEMDEMQRIAAGQGAIRAIPFLGEHADLNIRSKSAWLLELAGRKIFVGADASGIDLELFRRLRSSLGKIDWLFIGMECVGAPMSWLYGALFTQVIPRAINESRRFNGADFEAARKIVEILEPAEVYVYALGMEAWFSYFMGIHYSEDSRQIIESGKLMAYCSERGIRSQRLVGRFMREA